MNEPNGNGKARIWIAVIAGVVAMFSTMLTAAGTAFNGYMQLRIAENQGKAQEVLEEVHILTNSGYGVQLATVERLSCRESYRTGLAADHAECKEARRALHEHNTKQATVDAAKAADRQRDLFEDQETEEP